MKFITFYGASDDLVEVYSTGDDLAADEHNTDHARFSLTTPAGAGYEVEVTYTDNGTWSVSVRPIHEDYAAPAGWRMAVMQGGHREDRSDPLALIARADAPLYSMVLAVECDDDAILTLEDA